MTKTTHRKATPAANRWMLINRKTSKVGRTYKTRDAARMNKTGNQFIYDAVRSVPVR